MDHLMQMIYRNDQQCLDSSYTDKFSTYMKLCFDLCLHYKDEKRVYMQYTIVCFIVLYPEDFR